MVSREERTWLESEVSAKAILLEMVISMNECVRKATRTMR